ncbi:30S ribosomal protein S8e [Candidatus Pacearchaeota archaeon]|nr:30S ribosomal protein S8e [Candidatus Pacearchaeota archaeon]
MKQGRKISGGKYKTNRKKKLYERQGQQREVTLKETKIKKVRITGGKIKAYLLGTNVANVMDPKTKKVKKVKIKNVVETPQNFFLARQNRLIKSAIIETEIGKAKITNRPTQEGHVNAILIENKL